MRATLAVLAALSLAPSAHADGLPVGGVDVGKEGLLAPGGQLRYVTLAGAGQTLVAKVDTRSGQVRRHIVLSGAYTIPAVALDGSASGLSHDGSRLVLIRPRSRFLQPRTQFAMVDPLRMRARRFTIEGDFSFDAISPDGRSLYLIHYTQQRDPTRYEVRAYDLDSRTLDPEPVIDPLEKGEVMRGFPITRRTSADGRFAYTLYDGAGGEPFVHALDTSGRTAACIDLPQLEGRPDLMQLRLDQNDGNLTVVSKSGPLLVIDPRSREVSAPPAAAARPAPSGDGGGPPAVLLLLPVLAAGAGLLAIRRRRRALPA